MKKNNRKKNIGYLRMHIGHIIKCPEWNRGMSVRLEEITPEGCMRVKNFRTGEVTVLPKEYAEKEWRFG